MLPLLLCAILVLVPPQADPPASQPAGPRWVLPVLRAEGVRREVYRSAAARAEVSCYVFTPPAYAADPQRRFPVVYWLHGSGGGITGVPHVAARFAAAIEAGHLPPVIVVFPNGLPMGMWCNWADGSTPIESMLIGELVPCIDARFRTIAGREARIIEGFSMGGYGAARLGISHPGVFGGISMLGAGPLQLDFSDTPRAGPAGRDRVLRTVFAGEMARFEQASPWRLAERHAGALRSGPPIRIVIGERDETLRFNRAFHRHLERLNIAHGYVEIAGVGHDAGALIDSMGDDFWAFHRAVLAAPDPAGRRATEPNGASPPGSASQPRSR